ncbi:MAG: hypothetical protein V3V62_00405, partial [bacterium]
MFSKSLTQRFSTVAGIALIAASVILLPQIAQAGMSSNALQTVIARQTVINDPAPDWDAVFPVQDHSITIRETAELNIDGDADRRFDGNFDNVPVEDHSITIRQTAELNVTAPDADYENLHESGTARSTGRITLAELDVTAPDADYENLHESG